MGRNTLTVIAKVCEGQEFELKKILLDIGDHVYDGELIQFYKSPNTHFARYALLCDADNGARLLFSCQYDGDPDPYLNEIIQVSPGLDEIWGKVEGYTGKANFASFAKANSIPALAFYSAFPNTVKDIQNFTSLRNQIEDTLDLQQVSHKLDEGAPVTFLDTLSQLPQRKTLVRFLGKILLRLDAWLEKLVTDVQGTLHNLGLENVLNLILGGCPCTPPDQDRDTPLGKALTPISDNDLVENRIIQNQLNLFTLVNPKCLWKLKIVLRFLGMVTRFFPPGEFANISTIHFIHWVLIDNGKRMLLVSSYDSTPESYIDDFIKVAPGIDIWGRDLIGYPEKGLAGDPIGFTTALRTHQFASLYFYCAYPTETVLNISRDRNIALGMSKNFNRQSVENWLELL